MKQQETATPGIAAIKTVIFDCGRVITLDQDKAMANVMAGMIGASPEEFARAYSAERGEYDRGTMTAGEYWNNVAARFGARVDPDSLERLVTLDMDSWFTINPETVAIIRDIKASGRRLLILSNMNIEGKIRLLGSSRYLNGEDWVGFFDDIILSCDLRMLKPEPEIYRACLEKASAEAGQCLFIDDIPTNVAAAQGCGLHAVAFTDARGLRSTLEEQFKLL
ncbi:MAG TPA: HAD family phosphatase [Rectinemataceae bacterium]|nr:HAD family phosphatase [Rectinemataceae bacterium]